MLGKIFIKFSLLYKTELIVPVSQRIVRSPHKSLKNSRHNPGGVGKLVNNVFSGHAMPGGPTPYPLDKSGTPVTYLLKNTASLFQSK